MSASNATFYEAETITIVSNDTNFVVPASTPLAVAPGLEISYRFRSHIGSTGSFTSGLSQYPGWVRAALPRECGELHVPS